MILAPCLTLPKRALVPIQGLPIQRQHIKATSRQLGPTQQIVLSRKKNSSLLGERNTGQRAAKLGAFASPNFDKNDRCVGVTHDQINFPAAPARRSIIANQQPQPLVLKKFQGKLFRRIAQLFGRV